MTLREAAMHQLVAHHRQLGINPVEIHARKAMIDDFCRECNLVPTVPPDKRSMVARIRFPKDGPKPRLEFDALELVVNPDVPEPMMILRPQSMMGDPSWLSRVHFGTRPPGAGGIEAPGGLGDAQQALASQKAAQDASGLPEWHERVPRTSADAQEDNSDVLAQLSRAGGITPTDVVMKSLDGIDGVKDIVVLRFRKNGDVEMTATMDRMAIMGALQLAMGYVMRDGG